MYPCDFEEFIRAVGVQDTVIGSLSKAFDEKIKDNGPKIYKPDPEGLV